MRLNSGRFEVLQAYRAFAALGVVLHHINGKLSAPHYFGTQVPDFFSWGQIGVDFFFVLSGFIIAMCTQRARSAPEFLMNRALRIYPPFWLAFVRAAMQFQKERSRSGARAPRPSRR